MNSLALQKMYSEDDVVVLASDEFNSQIPEIDSKYLDTYNETIVEQAYSIANAISITCETILRYTKAAINKSIRLIQIGSKNIEVGILMKKYITLFHNEIHTLHINIVDHFEYWMEIIGLSDTDDIVFLCTDNQIEGLQETCKKLGIDTTNKIAQISNVSGATKLCGTHQDIFVPQYTFGAESKLLKNVLKIFTYYDIDIIDTFNRTAENLVNTNDTPINKQKAQFIGLSDVYQALVEKDGKQIGQITVHSNSLEQRSLNGIFKIAKDLNIDIRQERLGKYKALAYIQNGGQYELDKS